jgi:hypothetical protein
MDVRGRIANNDLARSTATSDGSAEQSAYLDVVVGKRVADDLKTPGAA